MEKEKKTPGKTKIIVTLIIIAILSCLILLYQKTTTWLVILTICGIIGLILSRKTKKIEDEFK